MGVTRKFQLEVVRDRKLVERVSRIVVDPDTKTRESVTEEVIRVVPESYMVYFGGGHSIWVESKAELARMGLLPHLNCDIDEETGEPVVSKEQQDLKATVLRKTQATAGALNG